MLKDKKIIIGVTGSIAAYKVSPLVRLLIKEDAIVQVIMTPAAHDFVTPLTMATLSGQPVLTEPFNPVDGDWTSHVELGLWADLMLIAPATANTLAKMAGGIADNLLLTTYLSAKCPVFFAPAMDLDMYRHPTTKQNIEKLQSFGNQLIAPSEGELASGLCGAGRMEEPENIISILKEFFTKGWDFPAKKIMVTAGPTFEAIDPVRFIGNHSSGLMGFAIANEFAERGGDVTLISGPTALNAAEGINLVGVTSADEMHKACMENFEEADIIVMTAAVADYTPESVAEEKIKKSGDEMVLKLKPTKDILAEMGKNKKPGQFLVGFALETEDAVANAEKKLKNKKLDLIVLNSPKDEGAAFGVETNKVTLITKDFQQTKYDLKLKLDVAIDIVDKIKELSV
ncbi:MAG: bifunctional phosphopantothenoylcysteine decarboxylase/phosphopantothenate--cysteine ligase CoaBC [Bacteroidales bacterium]|nr:bifunctional phosphopantothenoylcysteine decarboxylase/phosphopantothenate--cysteine ligase CoaBC [Bacteroidales bacterium]MCK5337993.1 bifunctional phosphopantothenoylcysteine decarboxylase/phosphopantothenate--cysteine ligase CoaBC [Bacteroidales bacterium]